MTLIVLCVMYLAMIGAFVHENIQKEKAFQVERDTWDTERRNLLDRIQAPSYDHLKHHEAKIIKAQKEEPKSISNLEVV